MEDRARPRMLLVNDDGVHAAGLRLLEELALQFSDDVWVVAPDRERSGSSHAVSITQPVRLKRIDDRHYAVDGTPTDCVILAYWELLDDVRPTVLLSGINHGENLADDLSYSGTTSIALEGALLGMRSIAFSQVYDFDGKLDLAPARRHGPAVLEHLLDCEWQSGDYANVNFPKANSAGSGRLRVTCAGRRLPGSFRPTEARVDGRRRRYHWISLDYRLGEVAPDTDLAAIRDGDVSITPLAARPRATELEARLRASLMPAAG